MTGALMNFISTEAKGSKKSKITQLLVGNPKKTIFKLKYSAHTPYSVQKFRFDYEGIKTMNETADSHFTFKIKRLGDLLSDTYMVINIPDIWSSIYKDNSNN